MAVYPEDGIQIKQKELTKTVMMISSLNKPIVSMIYTKLIQRCEGKHVHVTKTHAPKNTNKMNYLKYTYLYSMLKFVNLCDGPLVLDKVND